MSGRRKQGTTRCFVALLPSASSLDALVALQHSALEGCSGGGLRPVARTALHVTLAFLGERDAGDLRSLESIVRMLAAVTAPIAARSGSLLALPAAERARVVATALESGGRLEALAADLRKDLVAARLTDVDARGFLPHLTLARARTRVCLGAAPAGIDLRLSRMGLFASHLVPSGAYYEPLCLAHLAGPAD